MDGKGVLTEAAALIGTGFAAGTQFTIWFRPAPSAAIENRPVAEPTPAPVWLGFP